MLKTTMNSKPYIDQVAKSAQNNKTEYLHMLRLEKPWLATLPTLSQTKLEILQHSFPFDASQFEGGLLARLKEEGKVVDC